MAEIGTKCSILYLLLAMHAPLLGPWVVFAVRVLQNGRPTLSEATASAAGNLQIQPVMSLMTLQITVNDSSGSPLQALDRTTAARLWDAHASSLLNLGASSSSLGNVNPAYIGTARTGIAYSGQV